MMKRLIALIFVFVYCIAGAQQYDAVEQVKSDPRKAAGMEGPHRFEIPAPTPAPRGYKPFYSSHYGRHGSRYAWNSKT